MLCAAWLSTVVTSVSLLQKLRHREVSKLPKIAQTVSGRAKFEWRRLLPAVLTLPIKKLVIHKLKKGVPSVSFHH